MNRQKQSRITILSSWTVYETLFLFAYGLWLITKLLGLSLIVVKIDITVFDIVRDFTLICALLAYLLCGKWRVGEVFAMALMAIGIFVSSHTNASSLLDLIIFIFCGRYAKFSLLLKESIVISAGILLLVYFCSRVGLITNYVSVSSDGRLRQYIGFRYALIPAMILFNIVCCYAYLKQEKCSVKFIAILIAVDIAIFLLTDSRLSFFMSMLVLLFSLLMKNPSLNRLATTLFKFITPVIFIVGFIASFALATNYDPTNPFLYKVNGLLENRLLYAHDALRLYGTTLFGQEVNFVGNGLNVNGQTSSFLSDYNYVDMLFVLMPIQYGWIFTALFVGMYTYISINASLSRDVFLLFILFMIACHCFVDDLAIYLYYNAFLFLFGRSRMDCLRDEL